MKYRVTHSCGHATAITLFGPGKDRDRTLVGMAKRPCRDCIAVETNARADAQAETRDLPPLTGTPKQIEWADRCRYHALIVLDRVLTNAAVKPDQIPLPNDLRFPGEPNPSLGTVINLIYQHESARFWIDHARDAHLTEQRIIRDGIESNPSATKVVAGLMMAAMGVVASDRHLGWIQATLEPSATARLAAAHGASLDAYVDRALTSIRQALSSKKRPYVALSGGKDSAIVRHLVERVCPDVTLFWSDDELEYPESVALMERTRSDVGDRLVVGLGWAQHAGWFRPWTDRPFWREPLPGTFPVGMDADDWMASRGHDVTLLGTRAEESKVRAAWLGSAGPVYAVKGGTSLRCCPIWDWPVGYVYQYAAREGIALNPVYARLAEIGVSEDLRRVGPLPLAQRDHLVNGWTELLERLESRYGPSWT